MINNHAYHRKLSFQLKPPHVMSDAVTYSKVSSDITSMIGQTTAFRLSAISFSKGSSHPSVHSQCASRNVIVFPLTSLAPINLQTELGNETYIVYTLNRKKIYFYQ